MISHAILGLITGVAFFVVIGYGLSRIFRRNDIADPLWGLGFVVISLTLYLIEGQFNFRAYLMAGLVTLWGARLSIYLLRRWAGYKSEDQRYLNWRKQWGKSEPVKAFYKVFLLQGGFMMIIALPIVLVSIAPSSEIGLWDFLGVVVFLLGLILEATADAQLAEFKSRAENKGALLSFGTWAICRHPNYSGEILIWWGLFFICCSVPYGLVAIISPIVITFLLMRVSGVPMLEANMKSKGDAFAKYCSETPALFPGGRTFLVYLSIVGALILGDAIWLGFLFKDFYLVQSSLVGRISNGQWDIIPWAALLVYAVLAFGIQTIGLMKGSQALSVGRSAVLGLCVYSVFEFTNIAMVRNWPFKMAALDIVWGVLLCVGAGYIGILVQRRMGDAE